MELDSKLKEVDSVTSGEKDLMGGGTFNMNSPNMYSFEDQVFRSSEMVKVENSLKESMKPTKFV